MTNDIAKGARNRVVEREIPIAPALKIALEQLLALYPDDVYVIYPLVGPRHFRDGSENRTEHGGCDPNTLVQYFRRLYAAKGYIGATSHSGRRSFITKAAREASNHGSSLVDVQHLSGHRKIETTANYVELSKRHIDLVGGQYK